MTWAIISVLLIVLIGASFVMKVVNRKASASPFVPKEGALHRQLVEQAMQRQPTLQDQEEEVRRREAEARERQRQTEAASGAMTMSKAIEILGLKGGATKQEIRAAHINLIKRVHQDAGGSDFLAKQVNAARDFLLGSAKQ